MSHDKKDRMTFPALRPGSPLRYDKTPGRSRSSAGYRRNFCGKRSNHFHEPHSGDILLCRF